MVVIYFTKKAEPKKMKYKNKQTYFQMVRQNSSLVFEKMFLNQISSPLFTIFRKKSKKTF